MPHEPIQIVWDEQNLNHLLIERAARQITPEEVEDMLVQPETLIFKRAPVDSWQ